MANVEEDINESARSGDKFDQIQAAAGQAQLNPAHRYTKKQSRGSDDNQPVILKNSVDIEDQKDTHAKMSVPPIALD